MRPEISDFNRSLEDGEREICDLLARTIERRLPEAEGKVWHRHPVWFLDGNPTVGYSKQKRGIRLMFWSGAGFDEPRLDVRGGTFEDASIFYRSPAEVDVEELERWLAKSQTIAWDYETIVGRKGALERLR
ncbi:DUF1801 domain-containing protein [Salinarimonas rosea]|uniref:DUF1801 domain-containing protein n=1 Tax=Salinarimonas rosea TaxID=552063 RepID=UPI0004121C6F|nr:DUF1801 domain-containing protein [Salinarimonas rosea]